MKYDTGIGYKKGGKRHVFRIGMVLVACDRGSPGSFTAFEGKIHEMVEPADAGEEKRRTRKMGE